MDPDAKRDAVGKYREAPLHPRAFAARLGRTIFTNGKSDCDLVAGLYADTLAGGFGRAEVLEFKYAMWTDEEAVQLAEALPLAKELRRLNLWGNPAFKVDLEGNGGIGARGLDALAAALLAGAAPKLEMFVFDFSWGDKAAALRKACSRRGVTVRGSL
jgi:hypothetical protein